MNKHIHNVSIVVEEEGKCAGNCPGCELSLNKSNGITNVLPKEEIFEKINYLLKNKEFFENYSHLLFHPGENLLQHSINDIVEIFNYATKLGKPIQWEFTDNKNNKLLEVLNNKNIQKLIIEKKLYLNIEYGSLLDENFKNIFGKIFKIGKKKLLEKHNINPNIKTIDEFKKIQEETQLLFQNRDYIIFGIHDFKGKEDEIINFLDNLGFENIENVIYSIKKGGTVELYFDQGNINIILHNTMDQKIDKYGNNIWNKKHIEGIANCLLMNTFELSLGPNKKIIPHLNPCINHIEFGTINEDYDEIKINFEQHIKKISKILTKYMYKKGFNQSELCNMCKTNVDIDISYFDKLHYKYRKLVYQILGKLGN